MGSKQKKTNQNLCFKDSETGRLFTNLAEFEEHQLGRREEKQKAWREKKEKARRKYLKAIGTGSHSISTPPPAHATKKEEYVKEGSGHEASGAGDDGRKGAGDRDDKDCAGGGGGGGGGGDDGGDEGDGTDGGGESVYCSICNRFFPSKEFDKHVKRIHPMHG